jgi:hypothetical protein
MTLSNSLPHNSAVSLIPLVIQVCIPIMMKEGRERKGERERKGRLFNDADGCTCHIL